MKNRAVNTVVALGTLASIAGGAAAQATLVNDLRGLMLEVQVNADTGGDQQQVEYFSTDSGDDPFLPWGAFDSLLTVGGFSGSGRASGAIDTTTTSTLIAGTVETTAQATVLDETVSDAFALSRAFLIIGFTLDSTQQWLVDAELSDNGIGSSGLFVSEGLMQGGPVLFSWEDQSVSQIITLGPGDYTLAAEADATVGTFIQSSLTGIANFDVRFSLVPTPGAAAVLAGAGLLAARRRRG